MKKLVKGTILTVLALNLIACGKVGEELNPTYSLSVSNPDAASLRCLKEVDGKSETFETSSKTFTFVSNQANSWLYVSCQKTEKGTQKISAVFQRNGETQSSDECAVDVCIVSASGVTK